MRLIGVEDLTYIKSPASFAKTLRKLCGRPAMLTVTCETTQ